MHAVNNMRKITNAIPRLLTLVKFLCAMCKCFSNTTTGSIIVDDRSKNSPKKANRLQKLRPKGQRSVHIAMNEKGMMTTHAPRSAIAITNSSLLLNVRMRTSLTIARIMHPLLRIPTSISTSRLNA